jgi:hypothetical protein
MEQEQENVAVEIQQEEVVQSQEEQSTPQVETQSQEISDKEKNFLRLRETKEQLERENRELREAFQNKNQQQQQKQQEDDFGVEDDDLVEGKVVKKLYQEIRNLKNSYEQDKIATVPERLKNKFNDFDQVVTQENVEKLKLSEPELYASITSGSDLYAKGVSAYKTLKAMGIVKDDPYLAKKEQVQRNNERPLSAQAIKGQGALSEANIFAKGLTPELRKQLQQEMSQAVKAR